MEKKQDIATLPINATDASEACNVHLFPNVRKLLTILATLPVTTTTSERIAIAPCNPLKRIKGSQSENNG